MNEHLVKAALDVIEAARVWDRDHFTDGSLAYKLSCAVETLEAEIQLANDTPGPTWQPGTFADMRKGDRVRRGNTEAVVEWIAVVDTNTEWDARGTQPPHVKFKLSTSSTVYVKKADSAVEILRMPITSDDPDAQRAVNILAAAFKDIELV